MAGSTVDRWTNAAVAPILALHTCLTRCGARRRTKLPGLSAAPCLFFAKDKLYRAIHHGVTASTIATRGHVISPKSRHCPSVFRSGVRSPDRRIYPDSRRRRHYDLVCGQGRLEAFRELGQTSIPAVVVDVGSEDCLVMSLVENVPRRQHQALDLLHDIDGMRQRGHSEPEIAHKTGLTQEYVTAVLRLLTGGETRLLRAVETG